MEKSKNTNWPIGDLSNFTFEIKKKIKELIKKSLEKFAEIVPDEDLIDNSEKKQQNESLLQNFDFEISHPDKNFGDFSINIAFKISKKLKKNPIEIANQIIQNLPTDNTFEKIEVANPGFINFYLSEKYLLKHVFETKAYYNTPLKNKKIMVEFAHPNPFKAFHIGHLRNIIVGESWVRILEKLGAKVFRTNYQGDVGMHIAKCLWVFQNIDKKNYPTENNERVALLAKCYVEGANAFKEDEKAKLEITAINKKIYTREDEKINFLWKTGVEWSLAKFNDIYKRVYSHFDRQYMESEVFEEGLKNCQIALEKGILKKSDGAIIFDGSKFGLETRVFVNSEGNPTYEGKELGLCFLEAKDFGVLDRIMHNVATEQKSFFEVTFKVQELLAPEIFLDENGKNKQIHMSYGFVQRKGEKMSSRLGNVVLAEDLIDEVKERISKITNENQILLLQENEINKSVQQNNDIEEDIKANKSNQNQNEEKNEILAIASVKYAFIKVSTTQDLIFDVEESVRTDGNSGPYILYTYARAKSILRNSKIEIQNLKNFNHSVILNLFQDLDKDKNDFSKNIMTNISNHEKILLRILYKFPETIVEAGKNFAINLIANFLYDLAQSFNSFYHQVSVNKTKDENLKNFRLALVLKVTETLQEGLNLLGIKTLEEV
ncbi:MAG: arginine--tRNA ligase [Patescibacteria group bacterium]